MLLNQLLVVLVVVVGIIAMALAIFAGRNVPAARRAHWVATRLAGLMIVLFALAVATRSPLFGVDTVAYVALFHPFCERGELAGYEASYVATANLLNIGMLGACDVTWLPAAWVGLMLVFVLLGGGGASHRVWLLGLLMASLVGLELMTNALRQGLSVAAMVAGLSWWPRRRLVALLLAGAAVVLHTSAALIVLSLFAASLGWPLFGLMYVSTIGAIVVALQIGATGALLEQFLYEITKYLGHESDEIWVRVLAFACVVAAVAAPLVAAGSRTERRTLYRTADFQTALRLAVCCVVPLGLPYFGYRFIYGAYPLVLWFVIGAAFTQPLRAGRTFGLVLATNLIILFAWSFGSSYMRIVPFYE